jgi:hypothetical protein
MATDLIQPNPVLYISLDAAVRQINAIRTRIKPSGAKLVTEAHLKAQLGGKVTRGHILRTELEKLLAAEGAARVSRSGVVNLPVVKKKKPGQK